MTTIDEKDYHEVTIGFKSTLVQEIIQEMKSGPILDRTSMGRLVIEAIYQAEHWCKKNCRGKYLIDPFSRMQIFFEDANEAMLFKLSNG